MMTRLLAALGHRCRRLGAGDRCWCGQRWRAVLVIGVGWRWVPDGRFS